jgi:hypothetical protein
MRISNMKLINAEGCNSVDVSVNRLYTYYLYLVKCIPVASFKGMVLAENLYIVCLLGLYSEVTVMFLYKQIRL